MAIERQDNIGRRIVRILGGYFDTEKPKRIFGGQHGPTGA